MEYEHYVEKNFQVSPCKSIMRPGHELHRTWTVLSLIQWGSGYFQSKQIDSPRLTIELLLCHVLSVQRIALYSDFERPLTNDELAVLRSHVQRIAHHEPIQYVVGEADFFSMKFDVTPDVLIPRQETELLVEQVLLYVENRVRCLDVGTGSGIIAIAVAKHAPNTTWMCIDKSHAALDVARRNAERNAVAAQCRYVQMDFLREVPSDRFDIVCMNPPYIPAHEVADLDANVRDYEPHIALTDDHDGLTFYSRLVDVAPRIMQKQAVLCLELGWGMADQVVEVVKGLGQVHVVSDLAAIPRVLVIQCP